jgi:small subunit ribosomal protein S17
MSGPVKAPHTLEGKVVSVKMNKTVAVEIERLVPHSLYGKYIRRSSTLLAHDEQNESREGDRVLVAACRPLSKRKVWKLEKILDRQK